MFNVARISRPSPSPLTRRSAPPTLPELAKGRLDSPSLALGVDITLDAAVVRLAIGPALPCLARPLELARRHDHGNMIGLAMPTMLRSGRERLLRAFLAIFGLFALLAGYPLMHLWPSGWRWQPYNPAYEHMIVTVYAVLGLFLLHAARQPERHRSLILFAAWSTLAHGVVMGVDAVTIAGEQAHLLGDVPILIVAGIVLILLAQPAPPVAASRHNAPDAEG